MYISIKDREVILLIGRPHWKVLGGTGNVKKYYYGEHRKTKSNDIFYELKSLLVLSSLSGICYTAPIVNFFNFRRNKKCDTHASFARSVGRVVRDECRVSDCCTVSGWPPVFQRLCGRASVAPLRLRSNSWPFLAAT